MRRGRPTTTLQQPAPAKSASGPSPARGDPFAALDASNIKARSEAIDELSNKFPSLDDFSLAIDKRPGYDFSKPSASTKNKPTLETSEKSASVAAAQSHIDRRLDKSMDAQTKRADMKATPKASAPTDKPLPAPKPTYVSTGTMTSSTPPPPSNPYPEVTSRPIWRVPNHGRSESQPRPATLQGDNVKEPAGIARSLQPSPRLEIDRQRSPVSKQDSSALQTDDKLSKTKSLPQRPPSGGFVGSNLDYLRDHEINLSRSPPQLGSRTPSHQRLASAGRGPEDRKPIDNDTAYLRDFEASDDIWEKDQLNIASAYKRGTTPVGKLSDRLAKFETESETDLARASSPLRGKGTMRRPLSPVAPSEATSSSPRPTLIDTSGLEELEDVPPEMRREIERQQALQEERRVTEMAAQYRSQPGGRTSSSTRANTIQQRVQSLLDEGRQAPVQRTAAGYGKYTDQPAEEEPPLVKRRTIETTQVISPTNYEKPLQTGNNLSRSTPRGDLVVIKQRPEPDVRHSVPLPSASAPPAMTKPPAKPTAKPKPAVLRNAPGQSDRRSESPVKTTRENESPERRSTAAPSSQGSRLAALLAKDQEGVAEAGSGSKQQLDALQDLIDATDFDLTEGDKGDQDWELEFSRKYPSLGPLDMVETEIKGPDRSAVQ